LSNIQNAPKLTTLRAKNHYFLRGAQLLPSPSPMGRGHPSPHPNPLGAFGVSVSRPEDPGFGLGLET